MRKIKEGAWRETAGLRGKMRSWGHELEFRIRGGVRGAGMPAWTLKCITGLRDPEGQHVPWYANSHHRQPFVPSASDKGTGPSVVPEECLLLSSHQNLGKCKFPLDLRIFVCTCPKIILKLLEPLPCGCKIYFTLFHHNRLIH